jgi:hypothetical protein
MATLRLAGDSAGFVEVKAPSTAGNNTLTLPDSNGNPYQALITNGSGNLSWNDVLLTSGNTITGSVVFNSSVTFVSGLTSSGTSVFASGLTSSGVINLNAQNSIRFYDTDSSNFVAIQSAATVTSNITFTLPSADGTAGQVVSTNGSGALSFVTAASGDVTLTGTQTLTNKTLASPTVTGDLTINAQGDLRLADSDSSNYVALQAPSTVASNITFTLPSVDGTAGQVVSTDGSGALSFATVESSVNYPQNIQSAAYTLVIGDAGKQIFHPASDTASRTFTIPANSSVAFPIGTVVLFTNENNARSVNVAITTDTLVGGNAQTGTIIVPSNNTLQCIKVTSTKWMATYLVENLSFTGTNQVIAVSHIDSPFISVYPFSASTGFSVKFNDPATLPVDTGYGVAFNPAGDAIAVSHNGSPRISVYPWSGSGFGTKFSNPATLPVGSGFGVAFNPAGDAIAVAHATTPFISVYPWSGSGFGTKFSDPATLPAGQGLGVAFNPAGDAIAVAHDGSPRIAVYPWSGSGFGTIFSNPATLPTGAGLGVAFNPAGDAIAVAHITSPFVSVYPWSGSGFGTKFSDPATLPTGTGQDVAFNPAGDAIAVAHATTPFISVYPWSGSGFGTKFSDPATLPTDDAKGVAFNPAGDALAVTHATTPFISVYPWSGSGFGTKFSNPATLPTGTGQNVAFTLV